jgi:hypothetical protein
MLINLARTLKNFKILEFWRDSGDMTGKEKEIGREIFLSEGDQNYSTIQQRYI